MLPLTALHMMLVAQLNRCEETFKDALTIRSSADQKRQRHLLEGVLSDAWQHYCGFVRMLLIRSSIGCTTASGLAIPASIAPATWERASYIASRSAGQKPVNVVGLNSLLWREPTWGDLDKILLIVPALNPGNAAKLVQQFQGGLLGPKHMQIVRNACAHKNHQTRAAVQALAPAYIASAIKHPIESMTWREPASNEFAFISWLDDLKLIASGAVS